MKRFISFADSRNSIVEQLLKLEPAGYNRFIDGNAGPLVHALAHPDKERVVFDSNPHVVNMHRCVMEQPIMLYVNLSKHHETYNSLTNLDGKRAYYQTQVCRFNDPGFSELSDTEQAAIFITMVKLGFNGLVRLNSKGCWNVPFGKKEKVNICDESRILLVNAAMRSLTINHGEYSRVLKVAEEGDLVVIDADLSDGRGFMMRAAKLVWVCEELDSRKAHWMLITPDTEYAHSQFGDYCITPIVSQTRVSAKTSGRVSRQLLVITNYTPAKD